MNDLFYKISLLFFAYSFLAWLAETAVATIKEKDFRNRGFVSGPFCFAYGLTAVVLTAFFRELKDNAFFLFLGSMAVSIAMQWSVGKLLERVKQKKWWDYSDKKFNFSGYICLQYSVLWGLLGFLAVRYVNDFLLAAYGVLPEYIGKIVIWGLFVIGFIDIAGSFMSLYHLEERLPRLLGWNHRLQKWTYCFAAKISGKIEERIRKSYPATAVSAEADEKGGEIAPCNSASCSSARCSLTHIFWLFFIGAFLGDIVETIFCRITEGVWMSRSSLVWGPFSVVWGLAVAFMTALLYKDRDKEEHHLFWVGTFLGGTYEYICSVFTELVFGKIFWDYSHIPFNLGGRINLLFCFFWGIAAVVWMKGMYPKVSCFIELIIKKTGKVLTWVLVIFMIFDVGVSVMALVRYDTRADGKQAIYAWEQAMDEHFGDARMNRIYPNAKSQ